MIVTALSIRRQRGSGADYEVLIEAGIWVAGSGGQIPDGAVVCGGRQTAIRCLWRVQASMVGSIQATFDLLLVQP
ncbi:MAG: hypothetical protein JO033_23380 [Acidobacteriaceae bacterium]|nr:hypothetical protein [Acidobacteriaceae bacterium]MBV9501562.1 hypothetical protein [Acidobacteriaceae bacterium]